jgi:hypothetical protein
MNPPHPNERGDYSVGSSKTPDTNKKVGRGYTHPRGFAWMGKEKNYEKRDL